MDRVKSAGKVDFSEALRPWLDLRALFRAAEGPSSSAELQGTPIQIDKAEQRQRIVLQVRSLVVQQEIAPRLTPSVSHVLGTLETLASAIPVLPDMASLRLDVIAIDPYELPFHELAARVKETLTVPHSFMASATDVSVAFDCQLDNEHVRHMQIGPMMPAQLNEQFLAFRRENLPEQFLFVSLGTTIARRQPFELASLKDETEEFEAWAEATATEIAAMVRG